MGKIASDETKEIPADAVANTPMGDPEAYKVPTELAYGTRWCGETPMMNTAQQDHAFADGPMFKHGSKWQGIYVDPARGFAGSISVWRPMTKALPASITRPDT